LHLDSIERVVDTLFNAPQITLASAITLHAEMMSQLHHFTTAFQWVRDSCTLV
jgi:hypothetical protein